MLLNEMNSDTQKFLKIMKFLKESYNYNLNVDALTESKVNRMLISTAKKVHKLKESKKDQRTLDRLNLLSEGLKMWKVASVQSELTAPVVKEGLEDSAVDEAKVILAAQELSDQLQKMIETIAQMQVQDLLPIVDAMKSDIGPNEADLFSTSVDAALGALLDAAKGAKDEVQNAIMAAQGQQPTDMEGGYGDEMGGDMDMGMGGDMDMGMGGEEEYGMDDEFAGADVAAGPEDEAVGRALKAEAVEVFDAMLEEIQSKVDGTGRVKQSDMKAAFSKYMSPKG